MSVVPVLAMQGSRSVGRRTTRKAVRRRVADAERVPATVPDTRRGFRRLSEKMQGRSK